MQKKKIYMIGIGGAGTSSLARLYAAQGHDISGSDDGDGFYADPLREDGIEIFETFSADHISVDIDFVVHSTAFDEHNSEIAEVKKRGIPLLSYPEALGKMTQEHYTVAVCGTHGKTTTTALTVHALRGTGRNPQALVGSHVVGWSGGACLGDGTEFIIEADEYQNKLALYHPQAVILTSVDFDHPDFFTDFSAYKKVFRDFIKRVPRHGVLVACHDDKDVMDVIQGAVSSVITYGIHEDADVRIINRTEDSYRQRVTVSFHGEEYDISTKLLGLHNALNAVAAWALGTYLSKDPHGSAEGIAAFQGTARRAEQKGSYHGAVMMDDYAHHPAEISATLSMLRSVYPKKNIVAAFHPHTFSRTAALLDDFAAALAIADHAIILDIYSSAREKCGAVSSGDVVRAINTHGAHKAQHIPTIEELAVWAREHLTEQDVFVTLGAGDIWKVHDMIIHKEE